MLRSTLGEQGPRPGLLSGAEGWGREGTSEGGREDRGGGGRWRGLAAGGGGRQGTGGGRGASLRGELSGAREQILSQADEALAPLAKQFPDAQVGIRGSLARGTKGPHKANAPFDPGNFDVDAFIVSDDLAGLVSKDKQGFRNLARLPQFRGLVRDIGKQLQSIPGIRPDTFKVRVFSTKEFEAAVKANERHFVR